MSNFYLVLASSRIVTNTHEYRHGDWKPPRLVNNFKHPGKQTDKSAPLTWKHDNFPLRASQKNKILRERKRLCWQEHTSLTKPMLFIIWHSSVAGFRPIRHELPAATSKHSHVTIQPFAAWKHLNRSNIFVQRLIMKWFQNCSKYSNSLSPFVSFSLCL